MPRKARLWIHCPSKCPFSEGPAVSTAYYLGALETSANHTGLCWAGCWVGTKNGPRGPVFASFLSGRVGTEHGVYAAPCG